MKNVQKAFDFVNGYKTQITMAIAATIFSLRFWGLIDEKLFEYLMMLDLALLGGSLRSMLKKFEK